MTFTIIILVIFLLMQIILVCIQAAGLMLGLKWARAEEVTYSRSLKATFISIPVSYTHLTLPTIYSV